MGQCLDSQVGENVDPEIGLLFHVSRRSSKVLSGRRHDVPVGMSSWGKWEVGRKGKTNVIIFSLSERSSLLIFLTLSETGPSGTIRDLTV